MKYGSSARDFAESVSTVVLDIYFKEHFDWSLIADAVEKIGPHGFPVSYDTDVGRVVIRHLNIWQIFSQYLADSPDMKKVFEKGRSLNESLFYDFIDRYIGIYVKKLPWWTQHYDEMQVHKRRLKVVRKVTDS